MYTRDTGYKISLKLTNMEPSGILFDSIEIGKTYVFLAIQRVNSKRVTIKKAAVVKVLEISSYCVTFEGLVGAGATVETYKTDRKDRLDYWILRNIV